jgi:uncharacterized protein YndB with AHSA1/START domain
MHTTTFDYTLITRTSPDRAWAVVGDPAGIASWVPGVEGVDVDGFTRICRFADGRVQREEFSIATDTAREFDYSVDVAGSPMATNGGSMTVAEGPEGGSTVRWSAEIEFVDDQAAAMMVPMLRDGFGAAFENLARTIDR